MHQLVCSLAEEEWGKNTSEGRGEKIKTRRKEHPPNLPKSKHFPQRPTLPLAHRLELHILHRALIQQYQVHVRDEEGGGEECEEA